MAIFRTNLVPQVIPHGGPLYVELVLISLVFSFMTFIWHLADVTAARKH
jgi:hypothetical protein